MAVSKLEASTNDHITMNKSSKGDTQSDVMKIQSKPKPSENNIVQLLQNEINELKTKTENLEKDYKLKFQSLGVS